MYNLISCNLDESGHPTMLDSIHEIWGHTNTNTNRNTSISNGSSLHEGVDHYEKA